VAVSRKVVGAVIKRTRVSINDNTVQSGHGWSDFWVDLIEMAGRREVLSELSSTRENKILY
jgi:hypothetical protein